VKPSNILTPLFRVNAGTSMACPFITGLVALLLERNPALDPAAVKALLKSNSAVPGAAPGAFDPKWGFGLIDASGL
jgi:subtilisin family serine protease